jgi:GNAT superfamily N-acetyltransferase
VSEYIIRRAKTDEAGLLTELAFLSKSYWNYSNEYLAVAKHHMQVSEADINLDFVYIAADTDQTRPCGFYHLRTNRTESELVWLFVDPAFIGKRIGKLLWQHALKTAAANGIDHFFIKSDPFAEGFYLKQGAFKIGETPSSVDQKMQLPLLLYNLNSDKETDR